MIRKAFAAVLSALVIISCSNTKDSEKNGIKPIKINRVDSFQYGKMNIPIESVEVDDNSPTGNSLLGSSKAILIDQIDTIELKKGLQFGVLFNLRSDVDSVIKMKEIWFFPPGMTDIYGNDMMEFESIAAHETNKLDYACYVIEEEHEMVKGKWTLQIHYNDRMYVEKTFWMK